jgi:hypothetical protein
MSKYLKPVYEFLVFAEPMNLKDLAERLTELRAHDINFRVVGYSHIDTGMAVLIEKTVLTKIEPKKDIKEVRGSDRYTVYPDLPPESILEEQARKS